MLCSQPTPRTHRAAARTHCTGFTVIELMILLVILGILAALLLPALARTRAAARMTQSKNNLAQLGKAMKHYEGSGRGNLPADKWEEKLAPFLDEAKVVLTSPLRDKEARNGGVYSYALNSKVVGFGAADADKIAMVSSDFRVIEIENKKCVDSKPVITGEPVARYQGLAFTLHYSGMVRSIELAEIDLLDPSHEPLVIWWLPAREHGLVCDKVIAIDGAEKDAAKKESPEEEGAKKDGPEEDAAKDADEDTAKDDEEAIKKSVKVEDTDVKE